jgi:hypothetical protein
MSTGGTLVAHGKSRSNWIDTHRHIRRAQRLVSRYSADKVHPDEIMDALPEQERAEWDDLLKQIK